ncbi:MAG TPA: formyltransferase family protein [Candidatus Dormibacteraeota bacterium]|nr:formyltransferase family protein [Candidatus Dormibacteraeota bacterium]
MRKPSAILLGSKPGSVVALALMLRRGWSVSAVVASPHDRVDPKAGGLADHARRHGIAVAPTQEDLPPTPVDFVISYMFRSLVRAPARGLARRAALNFHTGPLPEYGGWAFYNIAILEGAATYGCTCHYMDDGFDSGPLLKVRRFPIDASRETAFSLEGRSQEEMVRLFRDFCEMAESGAALPREAQDPSKRRYLKRGEFEALKAIPEGADEETIQRYARAFFYPPFRGATMRVGNHTIDVLPVLAGEQLAERLHEGDVARLMQAADEPELRKSA